jgi:uncharacterized protein
MFGQNKPSPASTDAIPAGSRLHRWAEFVLRARIPILAVALGLTVFLGRQSLRLRPEWNEQAELSSNDPHLVYFRQFLDRFGGQEFLLVVLRTDDVFTPDFLGYLRDLTETLRDTPHATEVVSLATVPLVRGAEEDARIEPFFSEIPADPEAAERLRREALGQPLWVGTLVAADGRAACINVMLPPMSGDANERLESVAAVREMLRQNPHPGVEVFYTGLSPLASDTLQVLGSDLRRFLLLTPLLILVCLSWAFRTWRGVLAPAIVISFSVLWTLGLLAASGGAIDICTTMLPTLVAVNCLSYAIHLLNAYHESCARGSDHRSILVRTIVHMAPALFMAALTTAIGFGSQSLSDLRSLRQLGIFSGIGILLAFILCLALVPAMLSFLPLPSKAAHRHRAVRSLRWVLWRVAVFVSRDTWKIPVVLVLLVVLSAVGIGRIRVESQWARYLPESMPSIQGLRAVESELAGFYVLELELDAAPGTFRQPWALREIDRLQQQVAGMAGVDKVVSANDFLREAHRARNPAAADPASLPETAGQIAEYRLLYSVAGPGGLVDSFLAADGSSARLSVRIRTMTTADHLRLIAGIERFAAHNLDPRISLHTTGVVKLFAVKLHALVRSLFKSFGLSFLLIAALMSIQLRSLKAGLCSMIPNVLPIVLGFGLMGFLGIPLSASTVMIASVGIGIAVDDTIHVLLRYRRELGVGRAPASAMRRTLLGTGRAMVYSSLGLAAGFSILMFSGFRLNREFGFLTAFIMVVALLADLFVTPSLSRSFQLFRKEKP